VVQAVAAVLARPPAPLAVLGPPGVGKTTVAVTALHDPRVVKRYHSRRYFVRADGVGGRDALLAAVAAAAGVEAGPGLAERTWRELERGAALLVLDNAETPWDAEPLAVEELLAQLAAVPRLALVATVRGLAHAARAGWRAPGRVRQRTSVARQKRGEPQDHRHRLRSIRVYEYRDAATLLADFWETVDAVLREKGVIP
jgi:hypothetical protein